jgi:tetratricopeptide (TPR) repeat protein
VAKKEDVLTALSQIARKFRTSVGESLATVEKHNTPLDEATTTSLEALKAYSAGWKVARTEGEGAAIPLFKRAVEIDPGFAIAHAALGVMYGSTGESDLAAEYATKAYELRDRANDNERFFIAAYYDGRVTGNQERARQTCEAWIRAYPRQTDTDPYGFLSGFIYPVLGEYEKGAEAGDKVIELSPDFSIAYVSRGSSLVALDRLDEAQKTLQKASERGLDAPFLLLLWHDLAFLRADKSARERVVAKAQGNSEAEDWMADHEAAALAFTGQVQRANAMSQHAVGLAQQSGHTERAALFETRVALREAFFGNPRGATERARQALEFTHDREVEYGAGFALASSGDSSRAEALATDLEKRFPEDTSVRYSYVPVLRARLALNHGDAAKAIEQLKIAAPYETGTPRSAINAFFGAMYPVYVRGEAYLGAHQGAAAAAEFQKILSHRGVVIGDPIGALAHLQLGRAYALVGDNDRARVAYRDFLALWNDGDPDIPILKEAKAEYAKLN